MNLIKRFIFPSVCRRCQKYAEHILCSECLLGMELGEKRFATIYLFAAGNDFLNLKVRADQKLIESFALIHLTRFKVEFKEIHCEPELIFLKRFLKKHFEQVGNRRLFLAVREKNPVVLKRRRICDTVLLV